MRRAFGPDDKPEPAGSALACAAGALFVVGVLAILEWRWPLYFTQDDNLTALPVTIAGCRSVLAGVFPQWNPFQFLGQPTSVQSIFALTYPFTYVSFFIARAFGSDRYFVEVFSLLHFIAGYFACYAAARAARLGPAWAMLVGVATVLSGTALMIGRSYAQMTPVLVWMPLMIVMVERLRRNGGSTRWAVTTGVVIGLFCHCGNAQMWLYAVLFIYLAIALLAAARQLAPGGVLWALAAGVIGLGFSLPLAIPQLWFMQDVARAGGSGNGIAPYLHALLLPVPFAQATHPQQWGNSPGMATFYYGGTLLTVVAILGGLVLISLALAARLSLDDLRALVGRNVWLLAAAISILIALGPHGPFWSAMSLLPILNKFTGPWKLLLFFHLFAALSAALVLQRLSGRRLATGVAATVMVLLAYNAWHARGAFYNFADRPYEQLPPAMKALLMSGPETTRGRIFAIAPQRNGAPGYIVSLMHNLPSYYGIAAFDGYDPFTGMTFQNRGTFTFANRDPVAAFRAYGVRWIIVHETAFAPPAPRLDQTINPMEMLDPFRQTVLIRLLSNAELRLRLPHVEIGEIVDVDPLAFLAGVPGRPLQILLDQAGATVDVSALPVGGAVVVNILLRRGMEAFVDGRPVELTGDEFGRVVVPVPPSASRLRVAYSPPWLVAIASGATIALFGLLGCSLLARISHFSS
ncbi:MAG TPA: hypothetical protein VNM92_15650 [Thermoanaerobaculia bacterium]|nr:hypothetical protein [Thermoanaerobaculia bacterium]